MEEGIPYKGEEMTKQEKIREGIADKFLNYQGTNHEHATDMERGNALRMADNVIEVLHSQGVVIKVDKELPQLLQKQGHYKDFAERDLQRRLHRAGYETVEPLIEVCEHNWIKLRNEVIASGEIYTNQKRGEE